MRKIVYIINIYEPDRYIPFTYDEFGGIIIMSRNINDTEYNCIVTLKEFDYELFGEVNGEEN
jgi:hypothetical protein